LPFSFTLSQHLLALGILLSRLGDVGSTYAATPNLRLEANPIMRKGGWPLAWASLLLCLIAYYDERSGIMVLVASLLVTGSNLSKAWAMRSLGEAGYEEYMTRVVRASSLAGALAFVCGSAACVALVGGLIMAFTPDGMVAFWAAAGMLLYAAAVAGYGSLSVVRLFRRVRRLEALAAESAMGGERG
jgi:hypothetical protein